MIPVQSCSGMIAGRGECFWNAGEAFKSKACCHQAQQKRNHSKNNKTKPKKINKYIKTDRNSTRSTRTAQDMGNIIFYRPRLFRLFGRLGRKDCLEKKNHKLWVMWSIQEFMWGLASYSRMWAAMNRERGSKHSLRARLFLSLQIIHAPTDLDSN